VRLTQELGLRLLHPTVMDGLKVASKT